MYQSLLGATTSCFQVTELCSVKQAAGPTLIFTEKQALQVSLQTVLYILLKQDKKQGSQLALNAALQNRPAELSMVEHRLKPCTDHLYLC